MSKPFMRQALAAVGWGIMLGVGYFLLQAQLGEVFVYRVF
jgi:hypothetical protein